MGTTENTIGDASVKHLKLCDVMTALGSKKYGYRYGKQILLKQTSLMNVKQNTISLPVHPQHVTSQLKKLDRL